MDDARPTLEKAALVKEMEDDPGRILPMPSAWRDAR
jgi:hypothetical protein